MIVLLPTWSSFLARFFWSAGHVGYFVEKGALFFENY